MGDPTPTQAAAANSYKTASSGGCPAAWRPGMAASRSAPGGCTASTQGPVIPCRITGGSASRVANSNRVSSSRDGTVTVVLRERYGVLAISTLCGADRAPSRRPLGVAAIEGRGPRGCCRRRSTCPDTNRKAHSKQALRFRCGPPSRQSRDERGRCARIAPGCRCPLRAC